MSVRTAICRLSIWLAGLTLLLSIGIAPATADSIDIERWLQPNEIFTGSTSWTTVASNFDDEGLYKGDNDAYMGYRWATGLEVSEMFSEYFGDPEAGLFVRPKDATGGLFDKTSDPELEVHYTAGWTYNGDEGQGEYYSVEQVTNDATGDKEEFTTSTLTDKDKQLWVGAWIYRPADDSTSYPVPEPSTILLFGLGLLGIVRIGRKIR